MKTKIHLNQIGYITSMQKSAVVVGDNNIKFYICRKKDGSVAFEGDLSPAINDVASGDKTFKADFSLLKESGFFYLKTGNSVSPSFCIDDNPFAKVKKTIQRSFYFARCGTLIEEEYAGEYYRSECHTFPAVLLEDIKKEYNVIGGWHDSGDYSRYTLSAANTVGLLLYSYFLNSEAYNEHINIPESKDKMPDILSQCKFELDWLLKMQDTDGGVFYKAAALEQPENIMPNDDHDDIFLFPKSCESTLAFCAVTSLASRIFSEFDTEYSETLKTASLNAWIWTAETKNPQPYKDPEGCDRSPYICTELDDKFFWAASELYIITGEQNFHQIMKSIYDKVDTTSCTWQKSAGFGSISYIMSNRQKDEIMVDVLKTAFIYRADNLVSMSKHSGYDTALPANRYVYGSNMEICMCGLTLILANKISSNKQYINTAIEELNYIFGKNPMGISYVTGFGENCVSYPHHRPCTADGVDPPLKGLMVGGANMMRSDEYCKWVIPKSTPPAKCYVDKEHSYAVNNTSIYWNAAILFLTAYFSDTTNFY